MRIPKHPESEYLNLLQACLEEGLPSDDRTGVGTRSLFGRQMRFDMERGFPMLTTKKVHWKSMVWEFIWFCKGIVNAQWLQDRGVTIWDEWATPEACAKFGREPGDLGPVYGKQLRRYGSTEVDQLQETIDRIKANPNSRRHVVSLWHAEDAKQVTLPPCHAFMQFYARSGKLSLQMYQRSADVFLGVPFNIASYGLMLHMVAHLTNLKPHELVITFGDVHLYNNHFEQARTQLERVPRDFPTLRVSPYLQNIDDLRYDDFKLEGYNPHRAIKAPVAI